MKFDDIIKTKLTQLGEETVDPSVVKDSADQVQAATNVNSPTIQQWAANWAQKVKSGDYATATQEYNNLLAMAGYAPGQPDNNNLVPYLSQVGFGPKGYVYIAPNKTEQPAAKQPTTGQSPQPAAKTPAVPPSGTPPVAGGKTTVSGNTSVGNINP